MDVDDTVCRLPERGERFPRDRDEPDLAALQVGKEGQQLRRLARIAQGDDAVARIDKAEVAMNRILTIQNRCRCPGRVQGRGEFAPDVARFADSDDKDLRAFTDRGLEHFHGGNKRLIDPLDEAGQFLNLQRDNSSGFF